MVTRCVVVTHMQVPDVKLNPNVLTTYTVLGDNVPEAEQLVKEAAEFLKETTHSPTRVMMQSSFLLIPLFMPALL
jgi:phosphotransferase system IIA component